MYLRRIAATAIGRVPRVHSAASLPFATGPVAVDPGAAPDTGTAEQSVDSRHPGARIDRPETRGDSSGALTDPGQHDAAVAVSSGERARFVGKVRSEQPVHDSAVPTGSAAPAPLIEKGRVAMTSPATVTDDGSFPPSPGYASARAGSAPVAVGPVPADEQQTLSQKAAPSPPRGGFRGPEREHRADAPLDASSPVPSPQLLLPPIGGMDRGATSARGEDAGMTQPGRANRRRTESDVVDVHVTIGRIEIDARRAAPQDGDRRSRRERRPVMTLDEYLAGRERKP